jgi:hypothetical protein
MTVLWALEILSIFDEGTLKRLSDILSGQKFINIHLLRNFFIIEKEIESIEDQLFAKWAKLWRGQKLPRFTSFLAHKKRHSNGSNLTSICQVLVGYSQRHRPANLSR